MLELQDIFKKFEKLPVLNNVDLSVKQGEIMCLLGPSGCGKTTLLRIIAGLEHADKGLILVNGENIESLPVHRRDFGLMFQDFALFPHMNVEQNVAFGLRMKHESESEQQRRVDETLQLVGMADFAKRDVNELSGGEKQRVALARSLAPNPRLLMLDEPLGSLDAALRERLVLELRDIIKQVGLTAIYVTHDQQEAYAVADRIAIMNAGHIEQIATPEEVYSRPETVFVAQFLGLHNVIPLKRYEDSPIFAQIENHLPIQTAKWVLIHPDFIHITRSDAPDAIRGKVIESVFQGSSFRVKVSINAEVILMFRTSKRYEIGSELSLEIAPSGIIPIQDYSAI